MEMIGVIIAEMHLVDIIHGDLTTSNMMLRTTASQPQVELVSMTRMMTVSAR